MKIIDFALSLDSSYKKGHLLKLHISNQLQFYEENDIKDLNELQLAISPDYLQIQALIQLRKKRINSFQVVNALVSTETISLFDVSWSSIANHLKTLLEKRRNDFVQNCSEVNDQEQSSLFLLNAPIRFQFEESPDLATSSNEILDSEVTNYATNYLTTSYYSLSSLLTKKNSLKSSSSKNKSNIGTSSSHQQEIILFLRELLSIEHESPQNEILSPSSQTLDEDSNQSSVNSNKSSSFLNILKPLSKKDKSNLEKKTIYQFINKIQNGPHLGFISWANSFLNECFKFSNLIEWTKQFTEIVQQLQSEIKPFIKRNEFYFLGIAEYYFDQWSFRPTLETLEEEFYFYFQKLSSLIDPFIEKYFSRTLDSLNETQRNIDFQEKKPEAENGKEEQMEQSETLSFRPECLIEMETCIRFFWLQARFLETKTDSLQSSLHIYLICKECFSQFQTFLFSQSPKSFLASFAIVLPHCSKDNIISLEVLDSKISSLTTLQQIEKAKQDFEKKDYLNVSQLLSSILNSHEENENPSNYSSSPSFLKLSSSTSSISSSLFPLPFSMVLPSINEFNLNIFNMFYDACVNLEDPQYRLQCIYLIFCRVLNSNVNDFIDFLEKILKDLDKLILPNNNKFEFHSRNVQHLLNIFIQMLGRFSSEKYGTITLYCWICFFKLISLDPNQMDREKIKLCSKIHDFLHDINSCKKEEGKFLKLYANLLIEIEQSLKENLDLETSQEFPNFLCEELKKCFQCLYGLRLTSNNLKKDPKNQPVTNLIDTCDTKLLERAFELMMDVKRNDSKENTQFLNELTRKFRTPNSHKKSVEDYLLDRKEDISSITDTSNELSEGEHLLPDSLAKGLFNLITRKNFATLKLKKIGQELFSENTQKRDKPETIIRFRESIEAFLNDLYHCSDRIESWFGLGVCYRYLVDEILDYQDKNDPFKKEFPLIDNKLLLGSKAQMALNLAIRSMLKAESLLTLDESLKTDWELDIMEELGFLYWTQYRAVKYNILVENDEMEKKEREEEEQNELSKKKKKSKNSNTTTLNTEIEVDKESKKEEENPETEEERGKSEETTSETTNLTVLIPSQSDLLNFCEKSLYYFKKAEQLNPNSFKYSFMIGKLLEKLNHPPTEYLHYFHLAMEKQQSDKECFTAESMYALHSSRLKLLRNTQDKFENLELLENYSLKETIFDPMASQKGREERIQLIRNDAILALEECKKKDKHCFKANYQLALEFMDGPLKDLSKSRTKIKELLESRKSSRIIRTNLYRKELDRGGKYNQYAKTFVNTLLKLLDKWNQCEDGTMLKERLKDAEMVRYWASRHLTNELLFHSVHTLLTTVDHFTDFWSSKSKSVNQDEDKQTFEDFLENKELLQFIVTEQKEISEGKFIFEKVYRYFMKSGNSILDIEEVISKKLQGSRKRKRKKTCNETTSDHENTSSTKSKKLKLAHSENLITIEEVLSSEKES